MPAQPAEPQRDWTVAAAVSSTFDAIWTACCAYGVLMAATTLNPAMRSLSIPYAAIVHPLMWALAWTAGAWESHLYCRHVIGRRASTRHALAVTAARCLIAIWVIGHVLSSGIPPLLDLAIAVLALTGCAAAHGIMRLAIARGSRRRRFTRRALIIGTPGSIRGTIARIDADAKSGCMPASVCIVRPRDCRGVADAAEDDTVVTLPVVTTDAARRADYTPDCDLAVLAPDLQPTDPDVQGLLVRLEANGVDIICLSVPAMFAHHIAKTDNLDPCGNLTLRLPQYELPRRAAKRLFDIVVATICLIPAALIIGVTSLFIRHEDHGPVFFRQQRVGLRGRTFDMLKLRSMRMDAEMLKPTLRQNAYETNTALFKLKNDPRLTRTGRIIRRLSIDELPQLWNVLKGDMSIVGPRPPLPDEFASYDDRYALRMLVKPGLTGLWQVSGRSDLDFKTSADLDVAYVQNHSLLGDLSILLRTAWSVIGGKGAY
ncbi:exopolysaccharide biosynthesis polyprenyl glycosylphosphotransferase [Bifidobacterium sp. CP2]|uniref:sugar transferase n=1 Tax=Bifidobacterium sp. CP2 TaxID=2809025 RepID=UPI001BDC91CD|nr:exopolysaccharide biosynthesis polyprenyl glycosylphosphotransferase [Bifidobacterium sp. CP2]MBT1182132.1 exopolysaccharide biosynthesis polyprenyl glycosylphosphotransferase [Bifidobacterium sp. CP2]